MIKQIFPILCLFITLVSCQNITTISGKVYDKNKKPLDEAKVQIIGTDIYTFTNASGYFEIDALGRGDELLIVKPGFEMVFYEFKDNKKELNFYLIKNE